MNVPMWSYPVSPFQLQPTNYYSYPYHTGVMLNTSIPTSLNSSSGYESASCETSLIDRSPPSVVKQIPFNFIPEQTSFDDDDDTENYYGRKKRRVLSRPQRQEANRRERHRMEIINDAYEQLRNVLPFKKGRKRQKMSRMDTVDGAIRYIHSLLEILHGPNYDPSWSQV